MSWKNGDFIDFEKGDEVSHVVGSGKENGSMKSHWLKHSNCRWPSKCQMFNCTEPATVGAHIYPKLKGNQQNFILPTCQGCNMNEDWKAGIGFGRVKSGCRAVWIRRHGNTFQK
jgi:hypothetical protein